MAREPKIEDARNCRNLSEKSVKEFADKNKGLAVKFLTDIYEFLQNIFEGEAVITEKTGPDGQVKSDLPNAQDPIPKV